LRGELARVGVAALHARLADVDPESAAAIRPNDRTRVERALEVHALSGRKLSDLQREHGFAAQRYLHLTIHLEPPRELLHERIEARTEALFASGALERETRWLLERIEACPAATKALKIIGYGEMARALQGEITSAEARQLVAARTRQYAKRQRSWFTKDAGAPVAWPPDARGLSGQALRWYDRCR
jgi:tRNA dimethylallyltransferase